MNDVAQTNLPAREEAPPRSAPIARFVTGSIMRHVIVMTLTSSVGLMSLFFVDLASLFFLSMLGRTEITAAIGYAGTVSFVNLSFNIGIGIAAAALVAQSLGRNEPERAKRFATSALVVTMILGVALSAAIAIFARPLLGLLGAHGEALELARTYLVTVMPGFALLAGAITASFALRGAGDPTRAMYITLIAAIVNGILDPIFIFVFKLGIQGAAMSTVVAQFVAFAVGLHGMHRVHRLIVPFDLAGFRRDLKPIFGIAVPAVLTQLATPFATAYMTRVAAPFGDEAVAAVAIINRIVPVAFGVIFSLAGAVGPIIGQNFGAGEFSRVRRALSDGIVFAALYTLTTAGILFLLRHHVPAAFSAQGETARLVTFYCTWLAVTYAFTGSQFVAQAAFNNLGRPIWSTFSNWGRATIGTIPLVHIGAAWAGPEGVLTGSAIGSIAFGFGAASVAFWLTRQLEKRAHAHALKRAAESR
ncbi:MAG: MATE family efflux transporter [Hyphomicrobiales bacterium]